MKIVPQGWEYKPIEKLISLVMDFRGKTPLKIGMEWGNGKISSLSANNVQMGKIDFTKDNHLGSETLYEAWMNKGSTKKDDIVFTMEAPLGNVALIPDNQKYILSQRVVLLRANSKILPHYFFDYLMSDTFQSEVLKYASGSTVKGIQYSKLKEIGILYPIEEKEQQKIAEILSGIDCAIEATQTLIDKEKMIKKGLMADLLNHGIDEEGRIRTPQTHRYIESPLGMIPEGWTCMSLSDIGQVITGNTPSTEIQEYYNGNIPFIGPVDFRGTKYINDSEKKVSELGLLQSRKIPKDSIMTVCIGSTIGKMAIAGKESCTNQQINALACKNEFDSEYVFYAMDKYLQKQLDVEAGLQAVPIVNKSSFSSLKLPVPTKFEQQKIAQILSAQDHKIETEEVNLAKFQHLKKGLMQDLLSGKMRVK